MRKKALILLLAACLLLPSLAGASIYGGVERRIALREANKGVQQNTGDQGGVFTASLNETQEIYYTYDWDMDWFSLVQYVGDMVPEGLTWGEDVNWVAEGANTGKQPAPNPGTGTNPGPGTGTADPAGSSKTNPLALTPSFPGVSDFIQAVASYVAANSAGLQSGDTLYFTGLSNDQPFFYGVVTYDPNAAITPSVGEGDWP